jgi:hypothetical protein
MITNRRVQLDWNVHQTERDRAFPQCASHKNVPAISGELANWRIGESDSPIQQLTNSQRFSFSSLSASSQSSKSIPWPPPRSRYL